MIECCSNGVNNGVHFIRVFRLRPLLIKCPDQPVGTKIVTDILPYLEWSGVMAFMKDLVLINIHGKALCYSALFLNLNNIFWNMFKFVEIWWMLLNPWTAHIELLEAGTCIYVSMNKAISGWVNDIFVAVLNQAIIWTNVGLLLIEPVENISVKTWVKLRWFSFMKMHFKMPSAK